MKVKTILLSLFFCLSLTVSPLYAHIKVGTIFFDPPFVMSPGEGFDIDLIQILCRRMQESCELIPMDSNKLFTSLDIGKIDIAIGGIPITQDLLTHYIFSLPYMLSKAQFLILQNSPFKSIIDLKGNKIGLIRTAKERGVFYNYLKQNFVNQFQIVQYDDMEDLITALSSSDIAAAFIHQSTAEYWVQNGGKQFRPLDKAMLVGNGIAIIALPKNARIIQRINQQLQGMEKDNTYINIYKIYFSNN